MGTVKRIVCLANSKKDVWSLRRWSRGQSSRRWPVD